EEFSGSSGKVQPSEMKRRREGTSTDVTSKRAKKVSAEDEKKKMGECTKKQYFQRLWNEEDEIVMLQGIIKFEDVTGKSPFDDSHGFIEFVKKFISFEASVHQYTGKIRQLKRLKGTKRKSGFSEAHDQKCFKLAKSIWGTKETAKKTDLFSSPNGKMVEEDDVDVTNSDWFENSFLLPLIESLGVDSVKHKWSVVPMEAKKKIEERLELLEADEGECKKIKETLKIKKRECLKQKTDFLNEVIDVMT
ncbi:hypothetical protein ARALYDRAFT_475744, partial [Arabidopsis lyrata subsp. lyrata]